MATAVLDLEFERLPPAIAGLEHYSRALILIRLRGRPVGQALLPVVEGQVGGADLRSALMHAADWAFWENWLHDHLGWKETRVTNPTPPAATVAICTRDRTEDLRRCLEALMRLPEEGQELLVIDNCPSNHATRRLVEGYGCVRYVREDRPGLNFARNRALREAQHEIVAFTDDDAAPDPNWLRSLRRNFDHPLVLCVTGLTMPLELKTEAQEWFQRLGGFRRGFKRIVFDSASHNPLEAWHAGAGVNMALRRSVIEHIGPFDEGLDVGTPTRAGGDNDIFSRILAAGYRIVYEPEALNWHRHRYTWEELRRQFHGYGVGGFAVWTRSLLVEGEWDVLKQTRDWLHEHLPLLARSFLRRPGSMPLDLQLAHFRGCAAGPWAYLYARWRLRGNNQNKP